jgi:multiple sugar transport system ATP-binding protein
VEEHEAVVVGRFSPRSRIREGEEVHAVVDTRALHFFDPDTGTGIYDQTLSRKGETT